MLHSVHVYEISMGRIVAFLFALLMFCLSISTIVTVEILFWIMFALLPAFTVWLFRVTGGRSGGDDVQKNNPVGLRRRRWRCTCGTLFERVKVFNPFHTGRVPLDDPISLNSRLGEGRV